MTTNKPSGRTPKRPPISSTPGQRCNGKSKWRVQRRRPVRKEILMGRASGLVSRGGCSDIVLRRVANEAHEETTDPHNGPPVAKTKSAAKPGGKSKQQAAQASSSGGGNRKVVASQSEGFAASSTGRGERKEGTRARTFRPLSPLDNDVSLSRSHAGAGSAGDGGDSEFSLFALRDA